MTKVEINPGICGFITTVSAELNDDDDCIVKVESGCKAVKDMMFELGDTFDALAVCLQKPGRNCFYDYAAGHFPVHVACPVINGIVKCIEAESNLALKKDSYIRFVE